MGRQSVDQLQLGLHQQQGDDTEGSLVSMAEVGGPYAGAGTITGNVAGTDSCPIGWDPKNGRCPNFCCDEDAARNIFIISIISSIFFPWESTVLRNCDTGVSAIKESVEGCMGVEGRSVTGDVTELLEETGLVALNFLAFLAA